MQAVAPLLLTFLLSAASQEPTNALERGEKLLSKKQYAKAEGELRQAVAEDPSSARAHGNLALALLPQGKTREAVDEGRLAAAFGPQSPEARYIYGRALAADHRPVEAAREFEKAVGLKPGEAAPLVALAAAYASAEDERTASIYAKAVALRPADARVRGDFAEYLWRVDEVEKGNRVIEDALLAFPSNVGLTLQYGRALAEQQRYLDAAVALEKARRLGSSEASTFALLGTAYAQAGKTDEAIAALEEGVAAHPGDASLQHALGRLLLSQGKAREALPHLEAAAQSKPDAADIQLDLGRARETLGELDLAEASFRKAVRLSPNLPRGHYALGRLLLREGKKAEAERELATHHSLYERGTKIVSATDVESGQITMARSQLHQGKAAEALARFEALPESPESLIGRAEALLRLGRPREAVRALERALELSPDDHHIELLLVTATSRAGAPQ